MGRVFGLFLWVHAASCADFTRCDDHAEPTVRVLGVGASPDPVVPGESVDFRLVLMPVSANIEQADAMSITAHTGFGERSFSVCDDLGLECPLQSGVEVVGLIRMHVPLHTLTMAGQRHSMRMTLWGTPVTGEKRDFGAASGQAGNATGHRACIEFVTRTSHTFTPHGVVATSSPHARALRVALAAAPAADARGVAEVGALLRDAYAAHADWAETFRQWCKAEGKTYASVVEEARRFQHFVDHATTLQQAGRRVVLDDRSDRPADERNTLAHFA